MQLQLRVTAARFTAIEETAEDEIFLSHEAGSASNESQQDQPGQFGDKDQTGGSQCELVRSGRWAWPLWTLCLTVPGKKHFQNV